MNTIDLNRPTLMSWDEWGLHDAIGLAELVRKKQATPRELARQVALGIERVNPSINAVIEMFEDVLDNPFKDGMNPDGPFLGVPYLMKDMGPTLKGRKQEMGSLLMKANIATADSFLTSKIRNAGLNILGRTTVPEFTVGQSAENAKIYISRNPWDVAHTTGGSSAGAAAIVASGAIPIAHASDGYGSIRGPASMNGTFGLKPSRGVFSGAPQGSDLTSITAVQGCLSRTVRDTAAFIDSCRGPAPGEFMPFWSAPEPYLNLIERDPPGLTIAISHQWGDYQATPHIVRELERAGRFIEGLGHRVEWGTPDVDFSAAYSVQTLCLIGYVSIALARLAKLKGHAQPPPECIEPMNVKIWEAGIKMPATARSQIEATCNQVSRSVGHFFEKWDVLLTPVLALPTPRLGTLDFTTLNESDSVEEWFRKLWGLYPYTGVANLCGAPAMSLPMGIHANGMPLGIHAVARPANDGLLLQLAAQIERALNGKWNDRRPVVHVARGSEAQE